VETRCRDRVYSGFGLDRAAGVGIVAASGVPTMFRHAASAVTVAALVVLSGGCGTMINQSSEPGQVLYSDQLPAKLPYGGVARDLAAPASGIWQAATAGDDAGVLGRAQMMAVAVLVPPLDLPLSAVADTLFLPFDLAHQFGWDSTEAGGSRGGKGGGSRSADIGRLPGPPESR
jgi:uncharacterized protein YceK